MSQAIADHGDGGAPTESLGRLVGPQSWLVSLLAQGTGTALLGVGLAMIVGLETHQIGSSLHGAEYVASLACAVVLAILGAFVDVYYWKRNQSVYEADALTRIRIREMRAVESEKRLTAINEDAIAEREAQRLQPPTPEPSRPGTQNGAQGAERTPPAPPGLIGRSPS